MIQVKYQRCPLCNANLRSHQNTGYSDDINKMQDEEEFRFYKCKSCDLIMHFHGDGFTYLEYDVLEFASIYRNNHNGMIITEEKPTKDDIDNKLMLLK
jgi:Mut7-C RNAse domain-containing protein